MSVERTAGAISIALTSGAYFAIVFSIGFALGVVRTLWVAPRVGERAAELIASRDPIAGTAYAAALLLYAVMPLFVARARRSAPPR